MASLTNTAGGGTNGVAVTLANSGGTSGDAFNVSKPTGSTIEFSTAAGMDGSLGYEITTTDTVAVFLAWDDLPESTRWVGAFEFKVPSMPTSAINISRFKGVNTAAASLFLTAAGKLQLYNSGAAAISASLFSTSLTANTEYRIEYAITQGSTSTSGVAQIALYAHGGTTAIETKSVTGQNFDGAAGPISQFRVGQVAASAWDGVTYFDTIRVENLASGFIGPMDTGTDTVSAGANQTNIEPWTTVTLTATSSSGAATWSHVSGPSATLSGSGLTRTFKAPASFTVQTSVFRATNGTATDDVSITYLPATEGIVTSTNPVVVLPVRYIRKT